MHETMITIKNLKTRKYEGFILLTISIGIGILVN